MRRDNRSHTALCYPRSAGSVPCDDRAAALRDPIDTLGADDTRSRVSLIGKLGRSSRYKILMHKGTARY